MVQDLCGQKSPHDVMTVVAESVATCKLEAKRCCKCCIQVSQPVICVRQGDGLLPGDLVFLVDNLPRNQWKL